MKHSNTISYYKAHISDRELSLQFETMNEFILYVTSCNIQTLFVLSNHQAQYFACMQQGQLLGHPTLGYNTLQDYTESEKGGFPEASIFFEAKEKGYSRYSDYKLVKEAGISDKKVFDQIQLQGYIEGYEELVSILDGGCILENESIESPYKLFKYASSRGFRNYTHFKNAFDLGFTDAHYYEAAIEKGYKNHQDYNDGMKRGFPHGDIYYKAISLKVRDFEDYFKYEELIKLETDVQDFDKRILLSVISKLPQRKKVSINKLNDLFFEALSSYEYPETNELPSWITRTIFMPSDIKAFLETNNSVKRFGTYDTDGEYFETNRLNQRKVVLDGSNVAHAAVGSEKSKPLVENMIRVVEKLRQKGFDQIVIIADASLIHKLSDKDRLTALQQICEYKIAPAQTPADLFLIEYVKIERCLLVTNDTFRDWKVVDKWVAENIDYYKMTFMIEKENVLLPDIDVQG